MTRKQREQVVELLRCAADHGSGGIADAFERLTGIDTTGAHYQPGGRSNYPIWDWAVRARESVEDERHILGLDAYAESCLEAALRVEQGEWP